VVIDPRKAVGEQKKVDRALDKTEKEALQLKRALTDALSIRDRGTTAALQRINNTLERTELQAEIAAGRLRTIDDGIDNLRIKKFNDGLDASKKKASVLGSTLRRVFAGIGIALVIRQVVRLSDEFQILQNRLRTIIPDQDELNDTFTDLVRIANLTRTGIGSVVQLYQRGSLAADELGASQAELLLFTERVGKALAVQGSSAASSSGALLQLSQALGSGIVRAEEFNSILEGAFPIAQAAARGIERTGGSVSKLRGLIIKGEVTSKEFFKGFLEGSVETAAQFERTSTTIGQSFTVLGNNATVLVGKFNDSTGASSTLASGITLLGNNLELVAIVVGSLGTILVTKYVVGAVAARFATEKLAVATKAAAIQQLKFSAALAISVVAITQVVRVYKELNGLVEDLNRNVKENELDRSFNVAGTAIQAVKREIKAINDALALQKDRGFGASDSQLAQLAKLEATLDAITGKLRKDVVATKEVERATAAAAAVKLELAAATKRQADLLARLKAPQKEFNQLQADLNELLDRGKISQEKFNAEVEAARPKKAVAEDPFAQQVVSIEKRNRALQATAGLEGRLLSFARAKLAIEEKGRELTLFEKAQLLVLTAQEEEATQAARRRQAVKKLNEGLQARENELLIRATTIDGARRDALIVANRLKAQGVVLDEAELVALEKKLDGQRRLNEAAAMQARVEGLGRQLDVTAQLLQQEADLLELRRQQPALTDEIGVALEDLRLRQLQASTELGDGFTRAFAKIAIEAEDFAAVGEKVVNVFADRATDAIVEFAKTGKFEFNQFATAVLDDLIRIIARLLIVQALSAATGGVGGLLGGGINAGAQFGKTVQPGQAPLPVNEGGQELFVPNRTGTIVPNAADVRQPAPVVNVNVAIVADPTEMVRQVVKSGEVTEDIIVEFGANSDKAKQVLDLAG